MSTATFVFGPTQVRVEAPDAPLAWLGHFMRPWFSASGSGPFRTVELRMEPTVQESLAARAGAATETADCYLLDSRVVRLPVVDRSSGSTWVADTELGVVYGVSDEGSVVILAASDGPGPRVALMRVLREMAMVDALDGGRPVLHAAVVAFADGATAICGPKRSGKTTLLLHRLMGARESFVANDRCVSFNVAGDSRVRGLPTITALRADTVERFAQVTRKVRKAPDRHWLAPDEQVPGKRPWADQGRAVDLAPAQLCALLGVEFVPEASLQALVFPRVDHAAEGIVERALSTDETLARLQLSQVGVDHRSGYQPLFKGRSAARDRPSANDQLAAALAGLARVPALEVRLGANALEHAGAR